MYKGKYSLWSQQRLENLKVLTTDTTHDTHSTAGPTTRHVNPISSASPTKSVAFPCDNHAKPNPSAMIHLVTNHHHGPIALCAVRPAHRLQAHSCSTSLIPTFLDLSLYSYFTLWCGARYCDVICYFPMLFRERIFSHWTASVRSGDKMSWTCFIYLLLRHLWCFP